MALHPIFPKNLLKVCELKFVNSESSSKLFCEFRGFANLVRIKDFNLFLVLFEDNTLFSYEIENFEISNKKIVLTTYKEIFKNHPYNFAHENFDELKTKLDNLFKETD